jgi:hypothetical protein
MPKLKETEAKQMVEWQKNHDIQTKEKERVGALMGQCRTDLDLWQVMEREVFSLPEKLGITATKKKRRKTSEQLTKEAEGILTGTKMTTTPLARVASSMDVHGPLYPHYLATGINLLDTAFSKSSPLAFNIIPRVKSIGLPSYVLGVSTSLFNKLAEIHWNQFGDLLSTIETLEEMRGVGLWADWDTSDLLMKLRLDLHGCTWGAQGHLVMAMSELPPFNGKLEGRIEALENYVTHSIKEQGLGRARGPTNNRIEYEEDDIEEGEIPSSRGSRGRRIPHNTKYDSRESRDKDASHDRPDGYDFDRGSRNKFQYDHRGL